MLKILSVIIVLAVVLFIIPLAKPKKQETPAFNVSDLKFPKDFFWGAATASHQVEGNQDNQLTRFENANADRLASEAEGKLASVVPDWDQIKAEATNPDNYISAIAVDHYNRYEEDLDLARQIGLNAYRFSIEWSRVEPTKGQFNQQAIDHYKDVIAAMKQRGMTPFVTLWHRSEPQWILDQGDWENPETIEDYKKYVEFVVQNLGSDIKYWMTFNEPILHIVAGFVQGEIPPEIKNLSKGKTALSNMITAHNEGYKIIHKQDADAMVGSTQAMQIGYASPNTVANQVLSGYLNDFANWEFLDKTKDYFDFVGVQYYGPTLFTLDFGGRQIIRVKNSENTEATMRSDAGREVYPAGIYELSTEAYQRYQKPIIITENGIADADDDLRARYIEEHLYFVKKAMDEGTPIQGYIVWSLMDNFEWTSGYWPKFGLIKIDRNNNLKRIIQPSAMELKKIIEQSQN